MRKFREVKITLGGVVALAMLIPCTPAEAFTILHTFTNGSDGAEPQARLIADRAGNLYGTSNWGGGGGNCPRMGCGTIFKVGKGGVETVIYAFCLGATCTDGQGPSSGLTADKASNFYGVTAFGGAIGYGAIYKLAPDGSETVLYSFEGGSDGSQPSGDLILDRAGDLIGTTSKTISNGPGTVFRLAKDGTKTVLYTFSGGTDGAQPYGGVIADSAGNLYGTTANGGDATSCPASQYVPAGCGVVFKLAPDCTETVLHTFGQSGDGTNPMEGLVADSAGNLYGTTPYGGDPTNCPSSQYVPAGCGIVFKLAPDGTETVLHIFEGGQDGAYPRAGLIADETGRLYGTTYVGGVSGNGFCSEFGGCGTVFKVKPDGALTVIHEFTDLSATGPSGALVRHNGYLYGTTVFGGGTGCQGSGCGTVFRLHIREPGMAAK